jgi:hypothetical protein
MTEAARVMPIRLAEKCWSQGDLTREMSKDIGPVPSGLVNHWCQGRRVPGIKRAVWLQEHLGIDVALWTQPAAEPVRKSRRIYPRRNQPSA